MGGARRIEGAESEPAQTRTLLLESAERLFAERGIDAVSLREINRAAGQRNSSALHYHFGSRDALIEAIFERRMTAINTRRGAMIDEALAGGREKDLRTLQACNVWPLAEQLRDRSGRNFYCRFLAEVQRSPSVELRPMVRGKYDSALHRLFDLTVPLLPHLPETILRQRLAALRATVIFGVADIEQVMMARRGAGREFDLDRAVENLIDMATGALSAPLSAQTRARLLPEVLGDAADDG